MELRSLPLPGVVGSGLFKAGVDLPPNTAPWTRRRILLP